MSNFQEIQVALKGSRAQLEQTMQAQYAEEQALQLQLREIREKLRREGNEHTPPAAEDQQILAQIQSRIDAQKVQVLELLEQTRQLENELDALGPPQELIKNLKDDVPVLLMPLRVQTRFVRVKHFLKGVSGDHLLDVSSLRSPEITGYHAGYSDWSEDSLHCLTTLEEMSLKGSTEAQAFAEEIETALQERALRHPTGEWIKKVPDQLELWIRIYPDDIFVRAHESHLTPAEKAAGKQFWTRWWTIHQVNPHAFIAETESEENNNKPLLAAWTVLQKNYGHARAAWIFRLTTPGNFDGESTNYEDPPQWNDTIPLKSDVWTAPILSFVMPDHFVVRLQQGEEVRELNTQRIPYPLELVPAPHAEKDDPLNDHWRTDFEAAEQQGMAIRVNLGEIGLNPDAKIDSITVLGVKITVDENQGKEYLSKLFENHQYKHGGMSILPQGTPTNNFEKKRSGYSAAGPEPAAYFPTIAGPGIFDLANHWKDKRDGQYLAAALGLAPSFFQHLENGQSQDISAAIAMNQLLWPATLGYFLEQFLHPAVSKKDLESARSFFLNCVTGRGFIPAFRIGHQPYGLLTSTSFSNWVFGEEADPFVQNLYSKVLSPLDQHWQSLAGKVEQLSDPDLDIHKFSNALVKIIGLNASSEVLYQRPQVGRYLLNSMLLASSSGTPIEDFYRSNLAESLEAIGLPMHEDMRWLDLHYSNLFRQVHKPFIDHLPPSEERKLAKLEGLADDWNYLEWLAETELKDFQGIHFGPEDAAGSVKRPDVLLYLLARQGLSRAYIETAIGLLPAENHLINSVDFELENLNEAASDMEQRTYLARHHQIGITDGFIDTTKYRPNKWSYLDLKPTGAGNGKAIWEYMKEQLERDAVNDKRLVRLSEIKQALTLLKDRSTASLHRLFSEHLDLCNYRLDAWMTGIVKWRLDQLRTQKPQSLYLGGYGYVEHLQLDRSRLGSVARIVTDPEIRKHKTKPNPNTAVAPIFHFQSFREAGYDVDQVLADLVLYLGDDFNFWPEKRGDRPDVIGIKAVVDPHNQGFLHAPTIEHAIAGALLRSGYLANNPEKHTDEFAIDLSPERVRQSLYYLEGMKNGQDLAALLGYQFERLLHDNPTVGDLDQYLLEFRKAFPMRADKLSDSASDEPNETKEAFHVVDGLKLLNTYRKNEQNFALVLSLKGIEIINDQEDQAQIENVLKQLDRSMDAISDLMVSESIFQLAKGNLEKSSSVLQMMNDDRDVEVPEIVQSPRQHKLLAHVLAVQFDVNKTGPAWPGRLSPRSVANPHLNHWLAGQFPDPGSITVNVDMDGEIKKLNITNTGLQPIDFISLFRGRAAFSETSELSHYLKRAAENRFDGDIESQIKILYQNKTGFSQSQNSLYELKPLVDHLLWIVDNSRALLPNDLELSTRTDTLDHEAFSTLQTTSLIDRFEDIINGTNSYSILNGINLFRYHERQLDRTDLTEAERQQQFVRLQHDLFATTLFNPTKENYNTRQDADSSAETSLLSKMEHAKHYFSNLREKANKLLDQIRAGATEKKKWEDLQQLSALIFENTLPLFPEFQLINPQQFKSAFEFPDLLKDAGEFPVEEWLQGMSLVNEGVMSYLRLGAFRELHQTPNAQKELNIVQLPFSNNSETYRWLGTSFSSQTAFAGENLSLALETPDDFSLDNLQAGMVLAEWTEKIPEKQIETGIALHYDQSNAEPPQTLLLCVSPNLKGQWEWEDLIDTVADTINLAKKRAVEPDLIEGNQQSESEDVIQKIMDGHPLNFLLPAISVPVSYTDNTPVLNIRK